MNTLIVNKIIDPLNELPDELQWRVFEFARTLAVSVPCGIPGQQLIQFAGIIPPDDLQLMQQAIEEGCEKVDTNEC